MNFYSPRYWRGFLFLELSLMRPFNLLLWFLVALVWIAALYGLYHVFKVHVDKPEFSPLAVVGYCAALVALAGWMVQARVAVTNSKKQHTMNILLQTRLNPEFANNASKIDEMFPNGSPIDYKIIAEPKNKAVFDAVKWVLNYYEFVATGIRHGDLDEALMADCIRSQFCLFCARADAVIKEVREEDPFGNPANSRARILQSLRKLQKRWQRKIDRSARIRFWAR